MQTFDAGRVPPMSFGVGRLAETGAIAASLGHGPVLVVADAVLADLGWTAKLVASLEAAGLGVEMAAEVAGEPKDALVDRLSDRARAAGVGLVIGLGGGAAMDTAKMVAAVASDVHPALDYALGAHPFPARTLPAIAIPTTAGTGSEVTRTSIVSTAEGAKYWYWGEELMFAHAVLDPELTVSLPPHITAWTGVDAVAHALEAVTSRSVNAVGRLYGLPALETLAAALPKAVADGTDIEARAQVLWGATMAGLALHNCNTHMGHNISHALGSLAPVHHGLATGLALEVTLPELTERPEGSDGYAAAAAVMGGPGVARSLGERFSGFMREIRIDPQLPDACTGVTASALADMMRAPANIGMSQNAACDLTAADLDAFAAAMMARAPAMRATG